MTTSKTTTRNGKSVRSKTTTKKETAPVVKEEKRQFAKDDLILCTNVFAGTTVMIGKRTGNKYVWEGFGDEQEVEYEDLKSAALNKRSDFIYSPSILIQDEDFINEFPYLKEFYQNMIAPEDIVHLVETGTAKDLEKALKTLPRGLTDTIKGIVATMIQDGRLDSMKKIRIIDEVFGTELLKQVEMFS